MGKVWHCRETCTAITYPFLEVIPPTFFFNIYCRDKVISLQFHSSNSRGEKDPSLTCSYPDAQVKFSLQAYCHKDSSVQEQNESLHYLESLQRQSKKLLSYQFDSEVSQKAREHSPPTSSKAETELDHKAKCRITATGCVYFQIWDWSCLFLL